MPAKQSGVAALFAATSAAVAIAAAPVAVADTCDPTATVCQGSEVQTDTPPPDSAPSVSADDQYPNDSDWYFNPAGGGTELQPAQPPTHSGSTGGSGGGGGGHR